MNMNGKTAGYYLGDVRAFYTCLGHHPSAHTEFRAIDPTRRKRSEIRFIKEALQLETLVKNSNSDDYMLCVGINERPFVPKNQYSKPRAATGKDIAASQNIFLDFDSVATNHSELLQSDRDRYFLHEFSNYCAERAFLKPSMVVRSTGGNHCYFYYDRIFVSKCPDIAARIKTLMGGIASDLSDDLNRLELKLDTSTADLCRVAKIPGTGKPGSEHISRLLYADNQPDDGLRKYLLSLPVADNRRSYDPVYGPSLISIKTDRFQPIVQTLLKTDERLRNLARCEGKREGTDQSRSGYHYSFARRLFVLGVRDVDVIASSIAILAEQQNKMVAEEYLRRTVAAALVGKQY